MIDLDRDGSLAVLTLAHGKANAFDAELCDALLARIAECDADWCRAVVVTARGGIFSAGVDLVRFVADGEPYARRFLPALSDAFEALFALSKPMVAAVNGHAIAGGCVLTCCADRRLMARGTGRIGLPELLVGVAFPPVPLEIVRFAVASQHLSTLLLGGATYPADAAVGVGLIDSAVDADALTTDAMTVARDLAERPAAAFALTKQQLRGPALERMRAARRRLDADVEKLWASPDTRETVRTYVESTFKAPLKKPQLS